MRAILPLAVISLFAVSSAFADETLNPRITTQFKHKLYDHTFLPSFLLPAPFPDSNAQIAMGFAYLSSDALVPGTSDFKLISYSPLLQGQVAVGSRYAVNFAFSSNVITGVNGTSLVNYGASVQYNFILGLLADIYHDERSMLSASFTGQHPHQLSISGATVSEAVQELASGASAQVGVSTVQEVYTPSLRYAYAFSPDLAFKTNVGAIFNSFSEGNTTSARTQGLFGFGLEEDLNPRFHVALGITANYLRNQIVVAGAQNTDTLEFGLFDTFREAFNFGIELGKLWRNGQDATVGAILLRAYYN